MVATVTPAASTSGSKTSSSSTAARMSLVLPIACVLSMAGQADDCLSPPKVAPAAGRRQSGAACGVIGSGYNRSVGHPQPGVAAGGAPGTGSVLVGNVGRWTLREVSGSL